MVTSTFLASTFTPFLSKVIVVPFTGGSFTIITGAAGTTMTSFLVSAGLQDIIIKIAANETKPMIFFIIKFELKTLHFVTTLTVSHSFYMGQTSYPVYESCDNSFISSYWREESSRSSVIP